MANPNQTLPIILTPQPVPANIEYLNMTQLVQIVTQYMAAQISGNVSFFPTFATPPNTNQGNLIYCTTPQMFFYWDTGTGAYLPISVLFVATDPGTNVAELIFNTSDQILKTWNVAAGAYVWAGMPSGATNPTGFVGLVFYNTTSNCLMFWTGTAYAAITVLSQATDPAPTTFIGNLVLNSVTINLWAWQTTSNSYMAVNVQEVTSDPVTNTGNFVFNTTQNVLKAFDNGDAVNAYGAINGPVAIGDTKFSYVTPAVDDPIHGWFLVNNRTIDSIAGASVNQLNNLHTVFGAGAGVKLPRAPTGITWLDQTATLLVFADFPHN